MQNVHELNSHNLQLHLQLQETRRYSEIIAYLASVGLTTGLSMLTVFDLVYSSVLT